MKTKIRKLRVRVSQVFGYILILFICVSTSAWENIAPLAGTILFFMGVILVAIASIGRIWCSLYVGGFKANTLITAGPYSLCRNPLYFFSFIGALGVGLATETIIFTTIITIVFALYYPLVFKNKIQRNF